MVVRVQVPLRVQKKLLIYYIGSFFYVLIHTSNCIEYMGSNTFLVFFPLLFVISFLVKRCCQVTKV